jgi:hypothetical protein
MWGLLALAATLAVSWISYGAARRFVRERLRYVESALKPTAAIVAGFVALAVAWPVIGLIHWIPLVGSLVSGATAIAVGLSVGLGVNAGARDVRSGVYLGPGT